MWNVLIVCLFTKLYLGYNSVIESSFLVMWEPMSCCNDLSNTESLCVKYEGRVCTGRGIESLLIMATIEAVFGLATACVWTHSSPVWIHLIISVIGLSVNVGSMRFVAVPYIQFSHACRNLPMCIYHVKEEIVQHSSLSFIFSK